jgi:anhydro-N-acetylmuramic acid kinase
MVYNVIGITSGNSLGGLNLVFAALTEVRGKWTYEIKAAERRPYTIEWKEKLAGAVNASARDYLLLNSEFGHYIGYAVKDFIANYQLDHQVHFIAAHGHTVFHIPSQKMTAQLGEGAAIAAVTGLPVISDLRAMDVALGGKGTPLTPVAEQLLFPDYRYRLNLGSNATISSQINNNFIAFDICPCNYILDALAETLGKPFDEDGKLAAGGVTDNALLESLNGLSHYGQDYPKTLAGKFATGTVLPLIEGKQLSTQGKLNTYTHHIAIQIAKAISQLQSGSEQEQKLLLTGGGVFNSFLLQNIREQLQPYNIEIIIPDAQAITFRNALMMALLGTLRWRQEPNALSSVTGAERDSVGGALWSI